jgi:hypothetical protein
MKVPKLLIGGLLTAALALTACDTAAPTPTPLPPAPSPTTGATGAGGRPTLDETLLMGLPSVAAAAGEYQQPQDSTPDFAASTIYFTARNAQGTGIFKAPALGGATEVVRVGAPFARARGIVMSADGGQMFVADPDAPATGGKTGQIFALPTAGGDPQPVRGSAGTAPQNMAVALANGQETIYFTGQDPQTGRPAVLTLPSAGADAPTVVAQGAPLVQPDGIAVSAAGDIYVADRMGAEKDGKIFKVEGGQATALLEGERLGNPAGMVLVDEASILLISAVNPDRDSAQVRLLDLTDGRTGIISQVIGENPGAGGLHASPGKQTVLSWVSAPMGPIYKVMRIAP